MKKHNMGQGQECEGGRSSVSKLNYRFHNSNDPEEMAEYILKIFIEVNRPKVERALQEALDEENDGQKTIVDMEYTT